MNFIKFIINIFEKEWISNLMLFSALIASAVIAFFNIRSVNKNTIKQIENQNRQDYRPYLNVNLIKINSKPITGINIFDLQGNSYFEAYISNGYKKVEADNFYLLLELENYGNGLIDQLKLSRNFKRFISNDY